MAGGHNAYALRGVTGVGLSSETGGDASCCVWVVPVCTVGRRKDDKMYRVQCTP